MDTSKIIVGENSSDPILNLENPILDLNSIVGTATFRSVDLLSLFAASENFGANLSLAFGNSFDTDVAESLRQNLLDKTFELPRIEIRSAGEINGANGAYAAASRTIYLSQEFLIKNSSNLNKVVAVLLEEIGHDFDVQLNSTDSPGDEGEILSALVRGETLDERQLQVIQSEDDSTTVTLDGQVVEIEQNNPFKVTNNNDSGAGSLRQAIIYAGNTAGVDTIDLTGVSGTINLGSSLGYLNAGNDINFVDDGNTTISGQNAYQIITVNGANVSFSGLTFANGYARGGDGWGGGGGGLGAGGALFINAGNVTLNNVTFTGNRAVGGNAYGYAGIGGDAGNLSGGTNGGNGGNSGGLNGGSGVVGGNGGRNGYDAGTGYGEAGGSGVYGGGLGVGGSGGGGGGGGQDAFFTTYSGGNGGGGGWTFFGGGGGGGGGGGAGANGTHGSGGAGGLAFGFGGNGGNGNSGYTVSTIYWDLFGPSIVDSYYAGRGGQGGGGAGLGGAIFVNSGASLTLLNSVFTDNLVAGGTGANNDRKLIQFLPY